MNLQWTDEDLHVGINYYLTKPLTSEPSCHVKLFKNYSISWLFSSILFELDLSKSRPSHQKYHYPLSCSMFLNQYILYMLLYENLSSWRQRHPPPLYCNLLHPWSEKGPYKELLPFCPKKQSQINYRRLLGHTSTSSAPGSLQLPMCHRAKTVDSINKFLCINIQL